LIRLLTHDFLSCGLLVVRKCSSLGQYVASDNQSGCYGSLAIGDDALSADFLDLTLVGLEYVVLTLKALA